MILTRISLGHFRNHDATVVEPGCGVNAIVGDNGQGKTNILEAVSYVSLTKSFYASGDAEVIGIGWNGFELDASLAGDGGTRHGVRIACARVPGGKQILVDGTAPQRLASVIGRFPVVVLSPENGAITFGGPPERRRFMDLTLSQVSAAYLEDILEYRRALRQRNRILADHRTSGGPSPELIEPWTESLIAVGSRIAHRRAVFAAEFRADIARAYARITAATEVPDIAYVCGFRSGTDTGAPAFAEMLERALAAGSAEERRRGLTLAGPHRDDLRLTINGRDARRFASQGQHKTLLVALKIAEFAYMRERRGETPMLLLDDVFSELDRGRVERILGLTSELGQVLITATEESMFGGAFAWGDRHRRFIVERGTCRREP